MKFFYKIVLLLILSALGVNNSSAQVTKVKYQLRYNAADTTYDIYLIIHEGNATSSNDRAQFNAQISVLVPSETKLKVHQLFMPLRNNINYDGTIPMKWSLTNIVASPISKPKYDFISFTPVLSNNDAHRYNNLSQGDSIKLFSLRPNPMPSCLTDIRLFENGLDPNSAAPGMQGGNFSNGFTIGSIAQKYLSNAPAKNMPDLINIDLPQDTLLIGENIDLPSAAPNTYWVSNYPLVATLINQSIAKGIGHGIATFTLIDKANNKCGTSLPQFVTGGISYKAGPDLTVCADDKATVYGTNPTTGLWSEVSSNPAISYIENLGNGIATIYCSSLPGIYKYKYGSSLEGYDTMQVKVNPTPIIDVNKSFACMGSSDNQLQSNNQGSWVSNNPSLALVNNDYTIKPLAIGKVNFTFTDKSTGCSNKTIDVFIYDTPKTSIAEDTIKIATTTVLTPNIGGTWKTSNPLVASFTSAGLITAISVGQTNFTFTQANNNLCPSLPITLTVVNGQLEVKGPSLICVGNSAQLYPKPSDAKWQCDNNAIITVDNNGKITAHSPGTATVYLSSNQGDGAIKIVVNELPFVSIFSPVGSACIGSELMISDLGKLNYTWQSTNANVATIAAAQDNLLIKTISSGKVQFIATNAFGCKAYTKEFTVNPKPSLSSISSPLCLDATIDLADVKGSLQGTLSNLSPDIINIEGQEIKGLKEGKAILVFIDAVGCPSDAMSFDVKANPSVSYINTDSVEVGQTIELKPSIKGTWSGYDNSIANINDEGIVQGISAGITQFHFTDLFGCKAKPMAVKVFTKQILNGVANLEKLTLNFYPNPVNDKLYINSNATISEVRVYNLYGKIITTTANNVLYTNNLIPGVYLVEVLTSEGRSLAKIIKE